MILGDDVSPTLLANDGAIFGDHLFPLTTLVVLAGVAMAAVVALKAFANVSLPDEVFGFTWPQTS